MKFFNTVGVIDPQRHYFLPHRLNWTQLTEFIEKQYYFILHAPRQSGKTSSIIEFVKHLNEEGRYTALYLSTESAHTAVNDVSSAMSYLLSEFKRKISFQLPKEIDAIADLEKLIAQKPVAQDGILNFLTYWAEKSSKPLVLFFDEFDGLMGDSLVSMLKQFRTGYTNRPAHFPQTICLIGVRDLRDYKIRTKQQEELGVLYSPFNIKAESLLLPNFSHDDVKTLYLQHTQETGQQFTDDALEYAFQQTQGQPWLVNALAYQACFRDVQDRTTTITKEILERAREALIKRQDTHIDALIDRLQEPRVRNIMDAIIGGQSDMKTFNTDDVQYLRDLGLIKQHDFDIANPMYQEIIPRALGLMTQERVREKTAFYQNPDGSLNMKKLLEKFTEFYRENSSTWLADFQYKESGPHILLMAFMQRVINGGGTLHREYALDRKRVDLLISWGTQRIVIELKVNRGPKARQEGLAQTAEYMDIANATEGHLVIFDQDLEKSWEKKIYHLQEQVEDKIIDLWGM